MLSPKCAYFPGLGPTWSRRGDATFRRNRGTKGRKRRLVPGRSYCIFQSRYYADPCYLATFIYGFKFDSCQPVWTAIGSHFLANCAQVLLITVRTLFSSLLLLLLLSRLIPEGDICAADPAHRSVAFLGVHSTLARLGARLLAAVAFTARVMLAT